jgi:hypothetical protein
MSLRSQGNDIFIVTKIQNKIKKSILPGLHRGKSFNSILRQLPLRGLIILNGLSRFFQRNPAQNREYLNPYYAKKYSASDTNLQPIFQTRKLFTIKL